MTSPPRARTRSVEEMRALGRKAAEVLRAGGYVNEAACKIGVPIRTYREWLHGNDEAAAAFQAEVMPAYFEAARRAEDQCRSDIGSSEHGSGAWASWARFVMERRYPMAFGPAAQSVELTGKDGGPIQHQDVASMPTDELVALVGKAEEGEE